MRKLNRIQSAVFMAGGLLMAIGAILYATMFDWRWFTWFIYLIGAIMFTSIQAGQIYEGRNLVIRRLKRIQSLAGLLLVLAGLLMIADIYIGLIPFARTNYYTYLTYFYNKWVLLVLIGALLELYTTLRLGKELGNDKKN